MLDQKIGHALHRKGTHLPDVGGIVQHTRSNRLIELKRLIDKLDRSNQHKVKGSRFAPQIKQAQKTLDFPNGDRRSHRRPLGTSKTIPAAKFVVLEKSGHVPSYEETGHTCM